MKTFKLLVLIDSHEYAFNEIYQSQLWERIKTRDDVDVSYITLDHVRQNVQINTDDFDRVYIALKVRNTIINSELIGKFFKEKEVIVQDYDPWCNHTDDSPWKNGYKKIQRSMDVKGFFISSGQWTALLNSQNIPAVHIKLGMLNRHLSNNSHQNRRNSIEFRGARHQTRVKGYERLLRANVPIQWLTTIKPYKAFLDDLSSLGTWCHDESEPLIVDGKNVCSNWVWPKSLEALHRGCFLLREHQPESSDYGIDKLSTAFLYESYEEAKKMSDTILSMSNKEKDERMNETVSVLSKIDYYGDIIDRIKNGK